MNDSWKCDSAPYALMVGRPCRDRSEIVQIHWCERCEMNDSWKCDAAAYALMVGKPCRDRSESVHIQ
jgi:hypothetical protein